MSMNENGGVLVTGVNGFVGTHLVPELVGAGHVVYGASREPEPNQHVRDSISQYWQVDLGKPEECERIDWSNIRSVIHLAGLANVGASFDNPDLYMDINVGVLRNLFEAARAANAHPRVVAISTGAVYGRTDGPVTEDSPLEPGSPYAKSKLAAERLLSEYRKQGFDNSVNVRPFNHVGPGQVPGFLVPDLGYQIVEGKNPIKAGNLSSSRDYTDARDVVRAYRLLIEAPTLKYDVYNVCSGVSVKGKKIFDLLREAADKPDLEVEVATDRLRDNDEDIIVGSFDRLHAETGWEPQIPLTQTINDFITSIS